MVLTIFLSLLLVGFHGASCECPCMVNHYGVLSCEPHTITQFPEDLRLEDCNIQGGMVRDITLSKQSFTEIKDSSFVEFPNLKIVNFDYNEIEVVRSGAFAGVPEVHEINLKQNNIRIIEEGAFDDLVKLSDLDIRNNPLLETYFTEAWHFCERTKHGMSIKGSIDIFKNLQPSETTKDYCNYVQNSPYVPSCSLDQDKVLNCSGQKNLPELACHLQELDFSQIIYDFPIDKKAPNVENYHQGESNDFIKDFNSIKGSENYTKLLETVTLFNTKFDLSSLPTLTSTRTKEVIIKADTVYMTSPVTVHYKLTIHARVVALNSTIGMTMSKEKFLSMDGGETLEAWAFKEETVYVGRVLMRNRQYGLIEIVDQLPGDASPSVPGDFCKPVFINTTKTYLDLTNWFDNTFLNLNYVCARTVLSSGLNTNLAIQIANFTLNFAFSTDDIKDRETFMAAQKFKQIQILAEHPDVHNVPSYSIETVSKLAEVMTDRMAQYRANEIAQEEQLFIATGRVQDMQIQFDIIQQQQQMYFDMESAVLNAIWAATDNSWDFSFDHRNGIEDTINGAINASAEASFQMMEQEYKELLSKAEANVEHMEEVVEKYESQLGRLQEMAKASMDTMGSISQDLNQKVDTLDLEVNKFTEDVQDYIDNEICRVVKAVFECLVAIFTGEWFDAIPAIYDFYKQLKEIVEQIKEIQDALKDMDFGDLDNISDNLPTNFKTALQSATDLTKKGPRFDDIKNMAIFKMPGFEEATDGEVQADSVMEACANVADTGHAYTEATAEFANVLLKVADTKDEIRVAKADVGRAIEDVVRIQQMICDLDEHREDYQDYMKEAQEKYEDEVETMKEAYHDMSDELRAEFQANITAKFNEYQKVFKESRANYNSQMSRLLESITLKTFGLKRHSINQRGMIMSLYIDFCDAYFYHSFSVCDTTKIPLMSDSFELLLQKLSDIKWDSITSADNLPGVPIDFGPVYIMVEDQLDQYKYPISTLKNQSRLDVNLKEYDVHHNLDRFWRVRLNMLRIILLDENDQPIPSPGDGFGEEIQSLITFPTVFNDTFLNHDSYTFLCQNFFCTADYVTDQDEIEFKSSCEVNQEFTDLNYKPSADGIYSIYLPNSDDIALDDLAKLKVEFGGSYIPYNGEMIEWIY